MNPHDKAEIFMQALPYFRKYSGKIVVIKFGGNVLSKIDDIVEDIVFLKLMGIVPIVVHGGGPNVDSELMKNGITPKFINGLRYTDEKTVKMVGKVFDSINKSIVGKLIAHHAKSETLEDILVVENKDPKLGFVGQVIGIDKKRVLESVNSSYIPVISPLGKTKDGILHNINADTVAADIAVCIGAEKLTILTNVDGIKLDEQLITHLDFETAQKEIKKGNIKEGMIPKVEACIHAVNNNCNKAHLINGLFPHSLLIEIFTDEGIGTEIVH
jgi:acetylglutamate kinase